MTIPTRGGEWNPWFLSLFVSEIEWCRKVVLEHMLLSIPDASTEANLAADDAWDRVLTWCSDGERDPGDYADWAIEQGVETHGRFASIRQASVNMFTVMLWHLVEQQMLQLHIRGGLGLDADEEREVRQNPDARRRLFNTKEFHKRLDAKRWSMKELPSWVNVEELELVANSVKHGPGWSLDRLATVRPDLLEHPSVGDTFPRFPPDPSWVQRPAGGADLYVHDEDVATYFEAVISLWQEFASLLQSKLRAPST